MVQQDVKNTLSERGANFFSFFKKLLILDEIFEYLQEYHDVYGPTQTSHLLTTLQDTISDVNWDSPENYTLQFTGGPNYNLLYLEENSLHPTFQGTEAKPLMNIKNLKENAVILKDKRFGYHKINSSTATTAEYLKMQLDQNIITKEEQNHSVLYLQPTLTFVPKLDNLLNPQYFTFHGIQDLTISENSNYIHDKMLKKNPKIYQHEDYLNYTTLMIQNAFVSHLATDLAINSGEFFGLFNSLSTENDLYSQDTPKKRPTKNLANPKLLNTLLTLANNSSITEADIINSGLHSLLMEYFIESMSSIDISTEIKWYNLAHQVNDILWSNFLDEIDNKVNHNSIGPYSRIDSDISVSLTDTISSTIYQYTPKVSKGLLKDKNLKYGKFLKSLHSKTQMERTLKQKNRSNTKNALVLSCDLNYIIMSTSKDVIHSFSIPHLGVKMDIIPGRVTNFTLKSSIPGVYTATCAEFCGKNHAFMPFKIIFLPDFQDLEDPKYFKNDIACLEASKSFDILKFLDDPLFLEGKFERLKKTHPLLAKKLKFLYSLTFSGLYAAFVGAYIAAPASYLLGYVFQFIITWGKLP